MIKKVSTWGSEKNSGGKVYVPKEFIGRLVLVSPLTKSEEKEYYRIERLLERDEKEREKKHRTHINKLRVMREKRK